MNNENEAIRKTQQYALDIFKEFRRICEKNQLRYFAIGGTCIGAIRHHGFIPWDDDMDIAMPAEDYHLFMSKYAAELPEPYRIFLPSHAQHYTMSYGKIQNWKTTFVENSIDQYQDRYIGVNIDIFPVYGLPKDEKEVKKIVKINEVLRVINVKRRMPFRECESIKGKLLWFFLLPLRLFPFHIVTDVQDHLLKKHKFDESDKIYFSWRLEPDTTPGTSYTYKNIFFLDDFIDTTKVPFEDTEICIPFGYDRYLTMDFGDYMKLPPKEKQKAGHPKAIVDFDKPYTYYQKEN